MWRIALEFFEGMLNCAEREAWDDWGQLFHAFWFDDQGAWSRLDEDAKEKLGLSENLNVQPAFFNPRFYPRF